VSDLLQDLRFALRSFLRRPGFVLATILTLALGIGANTAVFAVIQGVLLRPFPFEEPDRVVAIWGDQFAGNREVEYFRQHATSFEAVGAWSPGWGSAVTDIERPTHIETARVSANFFDLLGVQPALGRGFLPGEDRPGGPGLVVISHALWQNEFGLDRAVLGGNITVDRVPYEIIGVAPPGFGLLGVARHDLWMTLNMDPGDWTWAGGVVQVIGRLAEGSRLGAANVETAGMALRMREVFGEGENYATQTAVIPIQELAVGEVRTMLLLLLGAVGFILLIAGANVGSLLLARATDRRREIALRMSLGAGRGRLVRQLITESAVLSALGGAAGLGGAFLGVRALVSLLPGGTPRLHEVSVDGPVLLGCAVLSLGVGLVFGLAPALMATRRSLENSLRAGDNRGGWARSGARLRGTFVAVQVALAMILLTGAGLMMRTIGNLAVVDPGFRTEGVLTFKLQIPGGVESVLAYDEIRRRLGALPGVRRATSTLHFPIKESGWTARIAREGEVFERRSDLPRALYRSVDPGFFEALEIALLQGRLLSEEDEAGAPEVVVINRVLAQTLFPGEDPVGRKIRPILGNPDSMATVVGVVEAVHTRALSAAGEAVLYRPAAQVPLAARTMVLTTDGDPFLLVGPARDEVWSVDADVPLSQVASGAQILRASMAQPRTITVLLGTFAAVGILLGLVGLYGVMAYVVGQRTREIGIRIALGAPGGGLVRSVVGRGLALAGAGVLVGLGAARLLARFLEGLVFGVEATDPMTFAVLAAGLLTMAAGAAWLPARRAARVDPAETLREE
jgi:predicted permease